MKPRKTCKVCKQPLPKSETGRKRLYCSTGCRQKAYRKRKSNPFAAPLKALRNDLYEIQDRTARAKGAVKVLEEMGYIVELKHKGMPLKRIPSRNMALRVVVKDGDNEGES